MDARANEKHNSLKYILDTNVFNQVVDGIIPLEKLENRNVFATHIQLDELKLTRDPMRRSDLLEMFQTIELKVVSTGIGVWEASNWGQAPWSGSGQGERFYGLLKRIKQLDREKKKKSSEPCNQTRDAIIAETAIKEGFVLVTNDTGLTTVACEYGCRATENFYKILSSVPTQRLFL